MLILYWYPKLLLCIWCSIFFKTQFFYQKCYMWQFLTYKFVCMIWLSRKYFLYYFLMPMCIRSYLRFVWNMKDIIWKSMVYFTLVIFNVTPFFWWKWGVFGSSPSPAKNHGMLYTIGLKHLNRLWISNFHLPKKTW